jgi:hypothetical protein
LNKSKFQNFNKIHSKQIQNDKNTSNGDRFTRISHKWNPIKNIPQPFFSGKENALSNTATEIRKLVSISNFICQEQCRDLQSNAQNILNHPNLFIYQIEHNKGKYSTNNGPVCS